MFMRRNFFLVFLVLANNALGTPYAAISQTIHIVIAGDTNDDRIGDGVKVDLDLLTRCFQAGVPAHRLELTTVAGNNFSRWSILRRIRQTNPMAQDGLVFIGTCHGGYDRRGHFLSMPNGGRLYRTEIVDVLRRQGAGTDVILTDSCNVSVRGQPGDFCEDCRGDLVRPVHTLPLFSSLFLDAKGLVDINSSSKDEFSLTHPIEGSFFIQKLCRYLHESSNQRMSWPEFAAKVNEGVKDIYLQEGGGIVTRDGRRFVTQTLQTWSLPRGRGRIVLPASLSLSPGDVMLAINGQQIRNTPDFLRAVERSPHVMTFTVRDSRDGTVWRMRTHLREDGGPRFGVHVKNNNGDGAFVTFVHKGRPARNNEVLGRVR